MWQLSFLRERRRSARKEFWKLEVQRTQVWMWFRGRPHNSTVFPQVTLVFSIDGIRDQDYHLDLLEVSRLLSYLRTPPMKSFDARESTSGAE